jgi:phospholipase C
MSFKHAVSKSKDYLRIGLTSIALLQFSIGSAMANPDQYQTMNKDTRTPIKHVIVIIGENRSFDHVYATYVPKNGEKVWNLLSEGIIDANGKPGPNFHKAHQLAAFDKPSDPFLLDPPKTEFPSNQLPAPLVGGPKDSYVAGDSLTLAEQSENGLPASYYPDLVSGGTGLTSQTPDTRITDVNSLPAGPFQLTNGTTFTYNAYAASPVHRFYQMWQQLNCSVERATWENPSGCDGDCSRGWKSPWVREPTE